jgi:hypothetical protein
MHTNNGKSARLTCTIIVALFLCIFYVIALTAAIQKSPTYDEPVHLFAGYAYLKWGDFRINPEHPPLAKVLAALPLLTLDINTTGITKAQRDLVQRHKEYGWVLADRFFMSNGNAERLFFYTRLVMIGLAAILGIFVFLWARELFGLTAGIVALALYCFDPNILAHSSLVHTDIPFALFFFAGTYFFWQTSSRFAWVNLVCTGVLFALAAITKFSFLIVLPVWAVLGIIRAFSSQPQQSQITSPEVVDRPLSKLVLLLIVLATALIFAYLVLWTAYGFRFDAVAQQRGQMQTDRLVAVESWLNNLLAVNSKHFVLPEAWIYGFVDAFKKFDRPSYLLGEISAHGSWLYFPVAFAVKTSLPTLLLFGIALTLVVTRRQFSRDDLFLVIPIIAFFFVAVCSGLNIGLRHILPIYPFLFVWLGGVTSTIWERGRRMGRWGVFLLGLWLVFSSLRTYPDYLAFFNEMAGGPANGHKFLVDSNLDWGQDLKGLKRWIGDNRIGKINFAYFGTMDPSYYGINAVPAAGSITLFWRGGKDNSPISPYIAISQTYLAGLYLAKKDTYATFRDRTPVANIGHSILIYRTDQ